MIVNRNPKCADERSTIGFMPMASPLSKDQEKAQIAALLKSLIREKGYTHQSFAEEIGVSPGLVSQWATNRGTVPAERALTVASLLGTQPELISPSWRLLRNQFIKSQSRRLDSSIILAAVKLASGAVTGAGMSHFDIETEEDAELFSLAIDEVMDDGIIDASDSDVQRFARKLKSRKEGVDGEVRTTGSDGRADSAAGKAQDGDASRTSLSRRRKSA